MREILVLFLLSLLLSPATAQPTDKPVAGPITLLEDVRSAVDQAYTYLALVKARLEHDERRLPEPTNMSPTTTRTDQETVRGWLEAASKIQDPKYYKEVIERIEAWQRILEKERQLNMMDCEVQVKSRLFVLLIRNKARWIGRSRTN
jgi:hypothetical protein